MKTSGISDHTLPAPDALAAPWARIQARLRAEYGESAYRNWLRGLKLRGMEDGKLALEAPTGFLADWIAAQYRTRLQALWQLENADVREIAILPPAAAAAPSADADAPPPPTVTVAADDPDLAAVSAPLNPRFTFDAFVSGPSNALACAAARGLAAQDVQPGRNPLFLCGGVGLGKTHLMHAAAWHLRACRPERRIIYLSAEKFMYQFIRALREKGMMGFKELFRSVDVLMIDDIQFIVGKESTQEEFFHTFNALMDDGRQVVISADRSPADLDGLGARVRSRLGCGLVAEVQPTTYALRLEILQLKAARAACLAPDAVLEFMARRITSNVRELEGALNRLAAHAELTGSGITLELAQRVLHDLLRSNERRINIEQIQKQVAAHYNIRLAEMHSARRSRAVARPRQVAMYLAKQLTSRSLPEIGRQFGGRDHTTVIHAVRKVEDLSRADAAFAEDVELLRRMLET